MVTRQRPRLLRGERNKMRLIIFGSPGSGKSTQAELLAKALQIPHFQTGELSRKVAQEATELGRRVKGKLDSGDLVSDEDMMEMAKEELVKRIYEKGLVLDGIPRNLYQAKVLDLKIDRVIYLEVSEQESVKRLMLRKRVGETRELIRERLRIYFLKTEPMLDYYQKKGILERVDGERPIEEIHKDILGRLEDISP